MEDLLKKYCHALDKNKNLIPRDGFYKNREKAHENREIDFYEFIESCHAHTLKLFDFSKRLQETNIGKIELVDGEVFFTERTRGIKMSAQPYDPRSVPFEMLHWGDYEKEERLLFDALILDGMTLLDVGGNIGWFSLYWGKSYPNSTVHTFEPILDTFKVLEENISLNALDNIVTYNLAVSNTNSIREFFYSPQSSVLASSKNILGYESADSCLCETISLDAFVDSQNIREVDLVRVDIEGDEFGFIHGATKTLERFTPILTLELFHEWSKHFQYEPQEVINFLSKKGYASFLPLNGQLEPAPNYRGEEFDRQNYFFLHADKHNDLISRLTLETIP